MRLPERTNIQPGVRIQLAQFAWRSLHNRFAAVYFEGALLQISAETRADTSNEQLQFVARNVNVNQIT